MVKHATAGLDQNIFVQKYMINLPSVVDLTSYIEKETEKEMVAADVWFKLFVILMVLGIALIVGSPLLV